VAISLQQGPAMASAEEQVESNRPAEPVEAKDRVRSVVLLVWAFQFWLSPVWLGSFHYGPSEWVWRSLTYGKVQFLKRARI
jgi:hypothetical protein